MCEETVDNRNAQIDALRGFAIFMVVLGHSIIYYPINLHEVLWCQNLFRLLSSIHMPLFFMISGFCYSYKGVYKDYIVGKAKRLLIPYLIFNLLDIIPRAMLTGLVNRSRDIGSSVEKIIFAGGEYWFLYTLFVIFIFFPVIVTIINKCKAAHLAIISVVLLIRIAGTKYTIFCMNQICSYLIFFYLGYEIKRCHSMIYSLHIRLYSKTKLRHQCFFILTMLVILGSFSCNLGRFRLGGIFISLMGILVCYLMSEREWFVRVFARFGEYSLPIYLFNEYLLVLSRTFICNILKVDVPLIIICFNMVVDFGISYFVIKYICCKIKIGRVILGMN